MTEVFTNAATMIALSWRTSRSKMAVAVVLVLASAASWPLVALALRAATDAFISQDRAAATTAGVLVAVGAIGALVLGHFAYVLYAEASEMATVSLDAELMDLVSGSARLDHHERAEYADEVTLLRSELPQFSEGMLGLMTGLSLVVSMTITSALLATRSPWLFLVALAAVPPVLSGQHAQRRVDRARQAAAQDVRLCRHLFKLGTRAASIKELQVYGLQPGLRRRHERHWVRAGRILARGEAYAAAVSVAGQVFFGVAYVAAVLLVLRQAVEGDGTIGDVVLVITLAALVHQQVSGGVEMLQKFQRVSIGQSRLRRMRDLIRRQESVSPEDATVPERIQQGIVLHGVSFTYPGTSRPILRGIDLELPAGSIVAIVGENGAGKTTLVKLLCRLYDATEGVVTVDGIDLTRLPSQGWRRRVTAAYQDFVRFELTAQHAVGAGDLPRVDDERAVMTALGRAGAEDLAARLDDGLSTQLGRTWAEGTELSGGQWQKLALGRAMMRETPLLLVLDEPTASLDAQAEQRLFEQYAATARAVAAETGGITLLVSHRFSTVRMANLIIVVEGGRVVEFGRHEDLLCAKGTYAQLYTMQAEAYV